MQRLRKAVWVGAGVGVLLLVLLLLLLVGHCARKKPRARAELTPAERAVIAGFTAA